MARDLLIKLWDERDGVVSVQVLQEFFVNVTRKPKKPLTAAKALGQPFYEYYVGQRITGFMGHWMTFSGHMMIALMILGALTNRIDVALWLLAIGPNVTVFHRIVRTWKQTRGKGLQPLPMPIQNSTAPKTHDTSPILTRSAGRGRI